MLLLLISLLAGILTVLAPCTISLLPVIVGGTLAGGSSTRRAITVTASLGISVILFTFLLKVSTALIMVPQEFWQYLSGTIIVVLGISYVFPALYESLPFMNAFSRSSNRFLSAGYMRQNVVGDILVGAALGPVFSSCSPTYFLILAAVLPNSFLTGLVYLIAYAVGLCGTLLLVTLAGQKLIGLFGAASDPRGWFKRVIGLFFIAIGVAIFFGYDKQLELIVADHFYDVTKIEQQLLPQAGNTLNAPQSSEATSTAASTDSAAGAAPVSEVHPKTVAERVADAAKAMRYPKAAEIAKPSGFINTPLTSSGLAGPIRISDYVGKKVVLIDFWTYSCINCQRTLPYVKAWYDKYKDQGLEIISIHTPEFGFEKVQANVEKAVAGFGIKYPVVMDNDYGTWSAFQNQYWPRKYLIDIDGYIVYDHAGEGNYDETESAIQAALKERAQRLGSSVTATGMVNPTGVVKVEGKVASPETYFGSNRNEYFGNGMSGQNNEQILTLQSLTSPQTLDDNKFYLDGKWSFAPDYAESQSAGAKIEYKFTARDVYFVASASKAVHVKVFVDGAPVGANAGADVKDGSATVSDNRLYHLVHMPDYGTHTLRLEFDGAGIEAYTFTFG